MQGHSCEEPLTFGYLPPTQCKVIVFMSTCNQVRYAYEALRRLRPGVPLRALHGKMKQMKRRAAFYDFCEVPLSVLHPICLKC
jgi:superfamily II DNA/RNA helicase